MRKCSIVSIILVVTSLALAVLGFFILPEQVVIQFSAGSTGTSTAPKLLALLIPTALGVGGAVVSAFSKNDGKSSSKGLLVSVIGIGVGILMIAINSLM